MAQSTLIVTGSSGLIGGSLIDRVGAAYVEFAFDRPDPPPPPPETEHYVACDLTSQESVNAALAQVRRLGHSRIASVIHLAAYYDFAGEPSPIYEEVKVAGPSGIDDRYGGWQRLIV